VRSGTGLRAPVRDAIAIWTHIAGQSLDDAPSVMAFVPALIHHVGAFVPRGGMRQIPEALTRHAERAGVTIRRHARVRRIHARGRSVYAIELEGGETIPCRAVVSNYHGVGTYDELADDVPPPVKESLRRLPLQSPGLCAYIKARGQPSSAYLRFMTGGSGAVTLAVSPAALAGPEWPRGSFPIRLIRPIEYNRAQRLGHAGQSQLLDEMLKQTWWEVGVTDIVPLAPPTAPGWGGGGHLYRDSMDPARN